MNVCVCVYTEWNERRKMSRLLAANISVARVFYGQTIVIIQFINFFCARLQFYLASTPNSLGTLGIGMLLLIYFKIILLLC